MFGIVCDVLYLQPYVLCDQFLKIIVFIYQTNGFQQEV